MGGDQVEHALAVLDAAAGLQRLAQYRLGAAIVQRRREAERAVDRIGDRPSGEGAGNFDDVLLGVAAVNAKRVELQQLARVVLVQAAASGGLRRRRRRAALLLWTRRRSRTAGTPGGTLLCARTAAARAPLVCHVRRTIRRFRIRTQPVIEIEQHRRALGRGAEQIAEG